MSSRRRQQVQKAQKHYFQVGDTVFFHATVKVKDNNTIVPCTGVILRQPSGPAKVCKVLIVAVASDWKVDGRSLLGKKILRDVGCLSTTTPDWVTQGWITLPKQKVVESVNRSRRNFLT